MAWTPDQVTALEQAVASGVLTVRYADRSVTYQSLSEMRALLAEMRRSVAETPGYRRVSTSKGFCS